MNIVICDDSQSDAKLLYDVLVNTLKTEEHQFRICNSGVELVQSLENTPRYDVAFLDVDMPSVNGIELGKRIKACSPKTQIVFVTGYPQYAIEAYDCQAFHYLLKPLDSEKVTRVSERLLRLYNENDRHLTVKVKAETFRIPIKAIFFIESCQKHVIYYTANGKFDTIGNLGDAYEGLKNYGFLQIHQGYIVNMDKISHFEKYTVHLIDGRRVPMSVRKRSEVLLEYARYLESH